MRLVQDEVATESPSSSQSSTSASTSTRSSQVTSGQHTATRIARVVEAIPEEPSHVSAVFDMRDNYSSEGSVVRVIQYYIGDSDEDMDVDIRAVVEEIDEHESLDLEEPNSPTTIILDSGADAPIFPASWISAGIQAHPDDGPRRLQDAQGNVIPTLGKREVEIFLSDVAGKQICLKERVTISDRVTQPILCYGKLMEQGWSIQADEQMLVHSTTNTRIPVDMQNRSLTVSGKIRLIQEKPHYVRMLKATLSSSVQDLPHGWHVNDLGVEVGYHISQQIH